MTFSCAHFHASHGSLENEVFLDFFEWERLSQFGIKVSKTVEQANEIEGQCLRATQGACHATIGSRGLFATGWHRSDLAS